MSGVVGVGEWPHEWDQGNVGDLQKGLLLLREVDRVLQ